MNVLSHLGCDKVFHYFEEVCDIPHGSLYEKALSDHIVAFAKERGLYCRQDERMNVVIKKAGTAGYENAPALIIQGHIDMVCEKNADTEHDFLTEPLKLYIDGDDIKAKGTTLGADNGIAVAYMLALLDAEDIAHPPIECVFTVEEEIGMGGATDLDVFDLEGKRFLNMDTEEEGYLMVSCCGGRRMRMYLPTERMIKPVAEKAYALRIRGLKGGHSGADIHLQRASANVLMGRALLEIRESLSYHLVKVNGGNMDNGICREAEAVFTIDPAKEEQLAALVQELRDTFFAEYKDRESDILMTIEAVDAEEVLTDAVRDHIIALLLLLPYGVQTMDTNMEGLVESSSNIGIVRTEEDHIFIDNAVRGSVESRKETICRKIELLGELCGAKVVGVNDYPGWQYNPNSELLSIFKDAWTEHFGAEPKVVAIHAGLECGLFAKKIPGLDLISLGPDMHDVHTPDERLSISSTIRVWDYLKAVLKKLK
ncbi:MAG: aminoacyl-histidine dipeptidase [Bacillota bacterium]|nr:aminoacyl-histidine dipeptidase [Bacillota bacterium]